MRAYALKASAITKMSSSVEDMEGSQMDAGIDISVNINSDSNKSTVQIVDLKEKHFSEAVAFVRKLCADNTLPCSHVQAIVNQV